MAKIKLQGNANGSGVFTLTSPNSNTDRTITLPDGTGTLAFTTGDDDKLPLAGGTMTGNIVMADDTSIGISDSAERIEFDGAGDINILGAKLGIGTTSPEGLLSLEHSNTTAPSGSDSPTASAIQIQNTGGANAISAITFTGADHSGDGAMASIYAKHTNVSENSESSALHFLTSHNEANVNALEITSDGRGVSQFTARAWINFDGYVSTPNIRDSHNISSITDNGTGLYTVNFTNNMANANYCVAGLSAGHDTGTSLSRNLYHKGYNALATGSFGLQVLRDYDANPEDGKLITAVVFGD